MCRQKYEDPAIWKARQDETEMVWETQYESSAELIDTPEYLKCACDGTQERKGKAVPRGTAIAAALGLSLIHI